MIRALARLLLPLSIIAVSAPAASSDPVPETDSTPAESEAYVFRFKFSPVRTIYYVIENDYSEGAAISARIPLSYNDSVIERRTYKQEVPTPTTRDSGESTEILAGPIQWICDRYEIRQQGSFREDAAFDSLRHTYPVASLRGLSKVHGSKVIFKMNPATAVPSGIQTIPGSTSAPNTSDKLSSTAQKCLVNGNNAESMLIDIGTYYFPDAPKRLGETWTITHRTDHRSFGTTITKLDCTLRSVRDVDGAQIATIELLGKVNLATPPTTTATAEENETDSEPDPENDAGTTRPTTAPATGSPVRTDRRVARNKSPRRVARKRPTPKDDQRRLERAVCNGTVEFDLTHGEVVQMNLFRELALAKTLSGSKPDEESVQARQTQSHAFRVRRYQSRPRYPIIQGGPQPPPEPVKKTPSTKPARRPTSRTADASRRTAKAGDSRAGKRPDMPTGKRQKPNRDPNKSQKPAVNKRPPPTSQARNPRYRRPTSRPVGLIPKSTARPIKRPTTQPARVPTTQPAQTSAPPPSTVES